MPRGVDRFAFYSGRRPRRAAAGTGAAGADDTGADGNAKRHAETMQIAGIHAAKQDGRLGKAMSEAVKKYEAWLADPAIDEETKEELRRIAGQPDEIEDRFFRDLSFGTGGLRGIIGAGTNRMNAYTVGRATQGLARWVKEQAAQAGTGPSVVIAHDSRFRSSEFAREAALVLAANGVKAFLFESLRPTPELSFAVRHLGATAGIVITASHNPPEYNGYKVYASDGCQLVPDQAAQVTAYIREVASFSAVKKMDEKAALEAGLLEIIGGDVDRAYIAAVTAAVPGGEEVRKAAAELKVVYTPLHGTGNVPVRAALAAAGFTRVSVVKEQEQPDPRFSTVKSPNPEERDAFELALKVAEREGADILIGTDPDCDRMGAAVRNPDGQFVLLTGNQAGAIMLHYLLGRLSAEGRLPADGAVIKTIVTSELGAEIARRHGLRVINTLTGFKYIGEKITQFEKNGGTPAFVFGYEESYGYLAGTYARDKDAVLASLLICEAAAWYKARGKTLYDVLQDIFREYGTHLEALESRTMKGKDGLERMRAIMDEWRRHPPAKLAGRSVTGVLDYDKGLDGLPRENVLKFLLEDGSWFCLRPSGTEPKIKLYFAVKGTDLADAEGRLARLMEDVLDRVQ
jgi:phosphoglucomutase